MNNICDILLRKLSSYTGCAWINIHLLKKLTMMEWNAWKPWFLKYKTLIREFFTFYLVYVNIVILYANVFISICRPRLAPARVDFCTPDFGLSLYKRNMTSEEYMKGVLQAKEHILAGDIFQIVLSQRFERRTFADPFEVYRALRVVNPSPYMSYLQVVSSLGLVFISCWWVKISFSFLLHVRLEVVLWLLQAQKFLFV